MTYALGVRANLRTFLSRRFQFWTRESRHSFRSQHRSKWALLKPSLRHPRTTGLGGASFRCTRRQLVEPAGRSGHTNRPALSTLDSKAPLAEQVNLSARRVPYNPQGKRPPHVRFAPIQWTVSKEPVDRSSKSAGLTLPRYPWRRFRLWNTSMYSNRSARASSLVR